MCSLRWTHWGRAESDRNGRAVYRTHVRLLTLLRLTGRRGSRMEKRWQNHGVNLQRLAQTVKNYYLRRNLKVKETVLEDGYSIGVILTGLRVSGVMSITIRGTPDDFTIETRATEEEDKAVKVGLMTSIFGGGSLVLRHVKVREQMEKMEREFWSTIEETIRSLTNSGESLA